ncbi:MAG: J domain-containing protein [Planctomycetes bacterium]|nr:J domain-containing protein [Planctomycetota bacterium]
MKFQDYYQTLGVLRTATDVEIKKAYRKLAKEWHPDRHPPEKRAGVEQQFKAISEAYDVLSDPEKRKRFDHLGEDWRQGQDFQPKPGGGHGMSQEEFARMFGSRGGGGFGGGGFSDFFSQMFGDMSQGAGGARAQRGGSSVLSERGADAEAVWQLTIGNAMRGGKESVSLQVASDCLSCDGEGQVSNRVCPACGGIGSVRRPRFVDLAIPEDVREGRKLRLRGMGDPGQGGGAAGDLYLRIQLLPDDSYRMRGEDVEADFSVAPWEALFGAKIDVTLRDRTATVKVPAGSHAGEKLRLRGQGLQREDGTRGDLLLVIRLGMPKEMTDAQCELLRQIAKDAKPVQGGVRT